MKNSRLLRISVILLIFSFNLSVFTQEKIGKEVNESYTVSKSTSLSIENKYGNVDIVNWEKNTVRVIAQIVLFDVNESKAEDILEVVDIKHYTEGDKIVFKTEFDEKIGKNILRFGRDNEKFEINYKVQMPHTVPVVIYNKYGDLFVERLSNTSSLSVKYGKIKINSMAATNIDNMSEIYLGYGEASIEEATWVKINCKYSKLKIIESKALICVSKYSKLFMTRGSSLVAESKYDTYEVGTIANFVGEAAYSNFRFKSVGKKLRSETKYTDVKIGFIPASFESIKISTSYGGYMLGIEEGASYTLKGESNYGNIVYPSNSRVNRFQKNSELRVNGIVGATNEPNGHVSIETKYGTVKLK